MLSRWASRAPERAIEQLNAANAKTVALLLAVAFALGHGALRLRGGPDSCERLLDSGAYKADRQWQPYGCMLHRYTRTDARHCFRYLAFWGRRSGFAFVGDDRMHQLMNAFVDHVRVDGDPEAIKSDGGVAYVDSKLRLSVRFVHSQTVTSHTAQILREWREGADAPDLIVIGCGFYQRNGSSSVLRDDAFELSSLARPTEALIARDARVLWAPLMPVGEDEYSPVNRRVESFNSIAAEILTGVGATVWRSSKLIAAGAPSKDRRRLSETALGHDVQVLLNMRCNDHMNFDDGTCCSSAEPRTTLQVVSFSTLFACMAVAAVSALRRRIARDPTERKEPRELTAFEATSILGLIVCYFYACDRTDLFMKENKHYSDWNFWLPVGYALVLGLFFTEESRSPKALHRDQTLEWRGWMQLLALAARSTGASSSPTIFALTRALNAGYLFLSGYGHFSYVWHTGDVSLVRLFRVLFRLNFMTVVLCFTMNRPYQFYHFVPLVSFWFVLLHLTLALPPRVTAQSSEGRPYQYFNLALKFVGLFAFITILYVSEVFFEKVFVTRPWKALFVTTDDDIRQWWTHWKRDRYAVACGAVFAFCFSLVRRHGIIDDSTYGDLLPLKSAVGVALIALVTLAGWVSLPFICRGPQECDEIHGYAGAIPVVCYAVLRNISGALRSRFSNLLAWFGDISLELFVCQHHIWLAADTHGVLVLVPEAPVLNLVLTSFIFVCVAHEVRRLTLILSPIAVPSDLKRCFRNLLIFVAILIPVGIHDGMF